MARQGYCVAIEPAGGGESIYHECYLSAAEVAQLRVMIVNCQGVDSHAIRPGPPTGDYPKGLGDLPRLLAQMNGGATPKSPPTQYEFANPDFTHMDTIAGLLGLSAAAMALTPKSRRTA